MKGKAIALINQDPDIKAICLRIDSRQEFLKKTIEALKEKAKAAIDQAWKENEPEWECLVSVLQEKGLLENYNQDAEYLRFSMERNIIELHDRKSEPHNPFIHLLRGLFE